MPDHALHVAQVNIGVIREPLTSELMADFVAALAPINALADSSPGFVWRLATEEGDATSIRPFADDRILVNMSVWRSIEDLRAFVYTTRHTEVLKRRREWFETMAKAYLALWWIPAGHIPTIDEAAQRLAHLETNGPGPEAFTFRSPYPPPHVEGPRGEVSLAPG